MREDEILSVARFKLGETARRLVVLAESATAPEIRTTLFELAEILLSEQRAIERCSRVTGTSEPRIRTLRSERDSPGDGPPVG